MTQPQPTGGTTPAPPRRFEKTKWPGVFKRGDAYVVRVTVGGRKRQRSAPTAREAMALRDELRVARARGEFVQSERLTLEQYASEWLAGYRGRSRTGVRAPTVAKYRRSLELHVLPSLGAQKLGAIRTPHVDRLARLLAEGSAPSPPGFARKPLAPGSVQRAIAPLRALCADAVVQGIIPANPCSGIRLPGPRLGDRDIRVLEPAQTADLIAAAPAGQARCLLRLLAETGIRISEASALRWDDLDLRGPRPSLRVERAIVKGQEGPPKSAYGIRAVPLRSELVSELRLWKMASDYSAEGDLVFCNLRGRAWDYRALGRAVLEPAIAAAGLKPFGFHALRHTCTTDLLRAGVPVVTVSRILGHHSAAFTLGTYGHLVASDLPDLDAIFGAGGSATA
jgi:integrase